MLKPTKRRDLNTVIRTALTGREEEPGAGGADDTTPDLQHPAVQEAIQAAVAQVRTQFESDTEGLRTKRDELLDELKPFKALGDPTKLASRLERLEELENAAKAGDVGADPDAFKEAVEKAAQEKYNLRAAELDGVIEQGNTRVAELEEQLKQANVAGHRAFVASQVLLAAMPKDTALVHPGAWDHLIDNLAAITVRKEVDGMEVARLKQGDTFVPGSGPDQLMTFEELLPLARQGKGPLPNLAYCFVSAGTGSKTEEVVDGATGGNWWTMTEEQRTEYINKHGAEKAKDLSEASEPPAQGGVN